jgi:hypothetical protein
MDRVALNERILLFLIRTKLASSKLIFVRVSVQARQARQYVKAGTYIGMGRCIAWTQAELTELCKLFTRQLMLNRF